MDFFSISATVIIGMALLFFIAEPDRILGERKGKAKKIKCTSWGMYTDASNLNENEIAEVEVAPTHRKERVIGGATTYAAGRGVKMTGA